MIKKKREMLKNGDIKRTKWLVNDKKFAECTYKNGKPNGEYESWCDNGKKYCECTYKNGIKVK